MTLDELEEMDDPNWCGCCETNPAKMEDALGRAEELATRWRTIAESFGADSVTRRLLTSCAAELAEALKGAM